MQASGTPRPSTTRSLGERVGCLTALTVVVVVTGGAVALGARGGVHHLLASTLHIVGVLAAGVLCALALRALLDEARDAVEAVRRARRLTRFVARRPGSRAPFATECRRALMGEAVALEEELLPMLLARVGAEGQPAADALRAALAEKRRELAKTGPGYGAHGWELYSSMQSKDRADVAHAQAERALGELLERLGEGD